MRSVIVHDDEVTIKKKTINESVCRNKNSKTRQVYHIEVI